MRSRRAASSARASSISRITLPRSTGPARARSGRSAACPACSRPRWYRSQISGRSSVAAIRARSGRRSRAGCHVAQQHALRVVVAGGVHGLRQVDDHRAVGGEQDVELRQVAVHDAGAQHAHHLLQQRGVVRARLLGREGTSFRRGAASPSASATSSISSTPSWKLYGRGTRTPAAASRYSASTSALCQAASCAWRPKRVPLAIARAWRCS
jgi:hypothetical protein